MRQRGRVKRRLGHGVLQLGCATLAAWALLAANAFALSEAGPVVTMISPPSGSIVGGSAVTITGHDLTGATAVTFGLVPAAGFTVDSDTAITATAPPRSKPGPVDVVITTPAGISGALSPDRFTYTACVVPKLKHRDLKAAKEVLRKKECRPGKVSRVPGSGKAARVIKQGKRPQTALPPGAKVSIRLGG